MVRAMKFEKILLLQQNMLGDVIVSTGLVRAIREEFPRSKIAFLVSPATADLVRLPFVDELIAYEKGNADAAGHKKNLALRRGAVSG